MSTLITEMLKFSFGTLLHSKLFNIIDLKPELVQINSLKGLYSSLGDILFLFIRIFKTFKEKSDI